MKNIIGDTMKPHKRLRREKDWSFAFTFLVAIFAVSIGWATALVYFVSLGY